MIDSTGRGEKDSQRKRGDFWKGFRWWAPEGADAGAEAGSCISAGESEEGWEALPARKDRVGEEGGVGESEVEIGNAIDRRLTAVNRWLSYCSILLAY